MNKIFLLIAVLLVLGIGGFFVLSQNNNQNGDSMMETDKTQMNGDSMMKDETSEMNDTPGDSMPTTSGQYIDYSKSAYEANPEKKRVLFFHASWCPTCKAANEEFMANPARIPNDTVLLKTDYDSEKELKQKYGITYQHTFVLVDENGDEVKKWNGGGIDKLISEVQ